MLGLRIGFTLSVMALAVWLASTGNAIGGLVVVPALAVWLRRAIESRA